jgi:hypothetical protein
LKTFWGFIPSLIAAILVLINAAALLAPGFYAMRDGVFFWLPAFGPASLAFAIGVIIGLILVIGSILMLLGYGTIGSVIVLLVGLPSLLIGGGLVVGFVLSLLGGILGLASSTTKPNPGVLPQDDSTFCPRCGFKMPRSSRYCPDCGANLYSSQTRAY